MSGQLLNAHQKHTRSKQTQEARLAQLVKGWIHIHTTQVQVLVKALGAYFLLNRMPPSSSKVGLVFFF